MKQKLVGFTLAVTMIMTLIQLVSPPALAAGEAYATVSTGEYHTMVIKADGSLWGWGWNLHGELGDGTTKDRVVPTKVMDNVIAVSANYHYTMAIKTDGSLWAWGYNEYGQLGDGTTKDRYTPFKIMDGVSAISAGFNSAAAVKTDGSLWVWGRYTDVLLSNDINREYIFKVKSRVAPIKVMDDVSAVSVGYGHTMAIKTDGSLWAWGTCGNGELGDGTTEENFYGINYRDTPVKVMDNVSSVSAGRSYTMAITTDGSLWAWGLNDHGQLGDGTRTTYKYDYLDDGGAFKSISENNDRATPIKVMNDVRAVSASYDAADYTHTMAIKTDGSLWAWGSNNDGQLGDGTRTIYEYDAGKPAENTVIEDNDRLTPVKVMDGVSAVSAGNYRTMAIKDDHSLWGWGGNSYAVLGTGTDSMFLTPGKMMDGILLPGQSTAPPALVARPTSATVLVNGKPATFDAYNVNNNNYFKLRDIAYILRGTNKQFEVTWDGKAKTIILISGSPYTDIGGEMQGKGPGDKTPTPTTSKIMLDGKQVSFTAYTIGDNNYFKLRDIGQEFNFAVDWDGMTNTINIDTSKGYTPG